MHAELRELTAIPDELAGQIRDLYERSFHPAELRAWDKMVESLGFDGVRRTRLIVATHGESLLGLSFFKYHAEPQFGYLWYLAVDATKRSGGIGSRLYVESLEAIRAIARENGTPLKGMMFEVERMNTESHPEYGDPTKRMRFYDRMGALMIHGYDYRQPPIPPHPEVPLQLMLHPVALPESACTQDEIATLVRDFLFHCQGEDVQVDPAPLCLKRPGA